MPRRAIERPPKRKAPGGKPGAEAGINSSREALHTDYHKPGLVSIRWQVDANLVVIAYAVVARAMQ